MKKLSLLMGAAGLAVAAFAHAEEGGASSSAGKSAVQANAAPQMSELPSMKAEGERIAALMEKLAKESDPAERRRIMAELSCAQ